MQSKVIVIPNLNGEQIFEVVSMAQIDWKRAPKAAHWWAMDANGEAHWFLDPNVAAFTDFWLSDQMPAPNFGFKGDWRESLTERPVPSISSAKLP